MKMRIKRIDTTLPLPEYKTKGAVAFDLAARVSTTIPAQGIGYVPLNVVLEPPKGFMVLMAARSSLHKKGLMLANGVGLFDHDFSGNDDEYHAALYNFTDTSVTVTRGDRLVQCLLKPYERVEWDEVNNFRRDSRGGFGSTGTA